MEAGYTDDTTEVETTGDLPRGSRLQPMVQVVIRGAPCLGEHGPEWQPPEKPRQLFTAITDCGYETLFTCPPRTGEDIFCRRCQDWERCRVIGGSVVSCLDCDLYTEHGHDRHRAVRQAQTHAVGRTGNRRVQHRARVGTHTREGIDWESPRGGSCGNQD